MVAFRGAHLIENLAYRRSFLLSCTEKVNHREGIALPYENSEGNHVKHSLMTTLSSQERYSHEEIIEEIKPFFFQQMPQVASTGLGVYPRSVQKPLPVWIAVGGTPASVVRAGFLGLPMALGIIGGQPAHFAPLVKLYWDAAQKSGHDATILPIGITSHGYVADTSQQARDEHAPYYIALFNRFAPERGWAPMTRRNYDAATSLHGAVLVGSPEEVIEKILLQHTIFGHQRFLLQSSVGAMPHRSIMRAIELFGTKVAPVVRRETAGEALTPEGK